eukprot:6387747-Amphidinium_carterae.1
MQGKPSDRTSESAPDTPTAKCSMMLSSFTLMTCVCWDVLDDRVCMHVVSIRVFAVDVAITCEQQSGATACSPGYSA